MGKFEVVLFFNAVGVISQEKESWRPLPAGKGCSFHFFSMMKGDLAEKKSSRGREQVPLGLALSSAPGVVSIDATYGIGCAGASCI